MLFILCEALRSPRSLRLDLTQRAQRGAEIRGELHYGLRVPRDSARSFELFDYAHFGFRT